MIDSHCHLDHEPLSNNLKEVISRSKAIGIDKLLTICTTSYGYENILKIVKIDPIIFDEFENITVLEFTNIKKNISIGPNIFVVRYRH